MERKMKNPFQTTPVQMEKATNNPIMIGVQENSIMKAFDVELIIGNFRTEHEAKAVANKLIKLVERELGSKSAKAAGRH